MNQKIIIQFWGDLICPMCPIGYVKLKQAIELFPYKDNVELVYRSFRLRPDIAPHSVDSYLRKNHGENTNVASILADVEQWGAAAGLTYKMSKTQAGDTMDAHRLVHLAKSEGLQMEAIDRIQKAHFAGEENIFDQDTLIRLAQEIGIDRNVVISMLATDLLKKEVEADQKTLQQMGISGVPFFLIDNQFAVRGMQEPEAFLAALNQAWETKKTNADRDITGMSCGTNCAF